MKGGNVIFDFTADTKDVEKKVLGMSDIVKGSLISKAIAKGIGVINDSLDGAISRVDILNNFPNVMGNLGIGAEESSEAIGMLSKSLTGLPTTLDSAASAVQRFTSKNGDVKKSAKMFIAVNNAILAGGAGTEAQASALEQLSQSYSKGVMDMVEWRSLQQAMPAQLKQVATAMGMTTDELGELLRTTDTAPATFDTFIDTIMQLNEQGLNGFSSFEEQARASTGGIATSITNLKTAVTRGVSNVINSINQMLEDNGLPNFSEIVQIVSSKISDAFSKISTFISNIDLSKVINGFNKFKDIIITLSPLILALVAGIKTYNAVMKITTAVTKALQVAQLLLNAAMNLNPVGLVIAGIVALVAGFTLLWKKSEKFRNFWIGLWNGLKNIVNSVVGFIKKNWKSLLLILVNPFVGAFKLLYDNCEGFRNFINNFVKAIKDFFVNAWNGIKNFFTETIPSFVQSIIGWLQDLPYKIGYLLGQIIGHIILFFQNAWKFITEDLPQMIVAAINWVASLPGKIWEWLQQVWQKVIDLGTSIWNWITTDLPQIINNIVNWFAELPGKIWAWLKETTVKIGNWLIEAKDKAWEGAKEIFNSIVDWFKKLPENLKEIGKNLVEGLWNGIKNAKDWVLKKIKEFGKGITDGIKDVLGIHSPSKVMFEIGGYMDKGLINGIESMSGELQTAYDGMFDLSPSLYGSSSTNLSPQVNVVVNNNMEQDPLGQMVNNIKTFSGGSKNDYNYGMGGA
jgi:tape measure domain-containing protein